MAGSLARRLLATTLAALAWVGLVAVAPACPFCTMQGQTLTKDANDAAMVLVGTFTNAKMGENFGEGTTELVIESVIKKHEILGDKKTVTLPRYIPGDDKKVKFLVFCDVFKGRIDPYRGVPVKADVDIAGYIGGALKVKDKKPGERLAYFFEYLDSPDLEVSNDAYKEFGNADYKDYKDMAAGLPADKIAKWLQDPNTPEFRYGLYASMLGHCGKPEHAAILRAMLEDPKKRLLSGSDGVLAGYVLLNPKDGYSYLCDVLKDDKKDFTQRYAALRATRFFYDSRPDVLDKKQVVGAVSILLDQSDISDLAIEDLRKWGRWELADRVIGLYDEKTHDIPIIRRSILRYALTSCAAKDSGGTVSPKAAAFVEMMRKKDPQTVADAEELLKLESTPPPAPAATAGKK